MIADLITPFLTEVLRDNSPDPRDLLFRQLHNPAWAWEGSGLAADTLPELVAELPRID